MQPIRLLIRQEKFQQIKEQPFNNKEVKEKDILFPDSLQLQKGGVKAGLPGLR